MFAKNPLRAESAGQRVEIMPVFCLGLSGLGKFVPRVTWASTRHARSSPGCHIAGFQPPWSLHILRTPWSFVGSFGGNFVESAAANLGTGRDRLEACPTLATHRDARARLSHPNP